MTLLYHTIAFLLWMGCTTCKASAGAACEDPPIVDFGEIASGNKSAYKESDRVQYVCNPGYTLSGSEWVTCYKKIWVPGPPKCLAPCTITRQQLEAQNLLLSNGQRRAFLIQSGQWEIFACMTGFKLTASPIKQCFDGHIELPSCISDVACGAAPEIPHAYITSAQQERYLPGARVHFECESNFQMMGGNYVTCTNGEWSQAPTCRGGKCGSPPVIENGDLLSFPIQEYPEGATLEYKCPDFYVLEGSPSITCTDGQWTSPPVCLVACTASEEDMGRNNIELKWTRGRKLYSRSGDFVEFQCKRGYVEDPASSPFRVECLEGTLEYPRCKPARDCRLNERAMEMNHIRLQSSSWSSPSTFLNGDDIFFDCKRWYRPVSRPEKFRAVCRDGVIAYPTCEYTGLFG